MNIYQAVNLANKMINNYPELKYWKVKINNRKSAFGICDYSNKQIELSRILIPEMIDNAIKNVIIHEIAHALTRGHGHDKVWKKKCLELGGNGQRCGGSDHYKYGKKGEEKFREKTSKYVMCVTW